MQIFHVECVLKIKMKYNLNLILHKKVGLENEKRSNDGENENIQENVVTPIGKS